MGRRPPAPPRLVACAALVAVATAAGCAPCSRKLPLYRIDVHTELHPYAYDRMLRLMDRNNTARTVNLTGGPPGEILAMLVELGELSQQRVLTLTNVDWRDVDDADFGTRAARNLERSVALGARGLMITKALGLGVTTREGRLLTVDDPRLDPLWAKAAELGVPVWIHIADPAPYFAPVDASNPRHAELESFPELHHDGGDLSTRANLLMDRDLVIARHPRTTFVCTGLASIADDVAGVDAMLDLLPNVYVDTAMVLSELGRQPQELVRALFLKHHQRILFGSGLTLGERSTQLGSPAATTERDEDMERFLAHHWRYLETGESDIPNPIPAHGESGLQGLALPRAALHAIYHANAERLLKISAEPRPGS